MNDGTFFFGIIYYKKKKILEANCYYDDVIVQMSYGHNFVLNNFGKIPKIGWAIDPCKKKLVFFYFSLVGHSNGYAYLAK